MINVVAEEEIREIIEEDFFGREFKMYYNKVGGRGGINDKPHIRQIKCKI